MLAPAINRDRSPDVAAFLNAADPDVTRVGRRAAVCLRCLSTITNREIAKYELFPPNWPHLVWILVEMTRRRPRGEKMHKREGERFVGAYFEARSSFTSACISLRRVKLNRDSTLLLNFSLENESDISLSVPPPPFIASCENGVALRKIRALTSFGCR